MSLIKNLTPALLMTGITIGAGILSLPYVFVPFGMLGAAAVVVMLGGLSLGINTMIADLAYAIPGHHQLPGLVGAVLGKNMQRIVMVLIVCAWLGSLGAYSVGSGALLSGLVGGSARVWSVVAWAVFSMVAVAGFNVVTHVVRRASLGVMIMFIGSALYASLYTSPVDMPRVAPDATDYARAVGATWFALHGMSALGEMRRLIANNRVRFRRAVLWGTLIPVVVYVVFVVASLRSAGDIMTPVATSALWTRVGLWPGVVVMIGSFIAMAGCYIGIATALRDTLVWDVRWSVRTAYAVALGIPLLVALYGTAYFSRITSVIGGVFLGLQSCFLLYTYGVAVRRGMVVRSLGPRLVWYVVVPCMIVCGYIVLMSFI